MSPSLTLTSYAIVGCQQVWIDSDWPSISLRIDRNDHHQLLGGAQINMEIEQKLFQTTYSHDQFVA